MSSISFSHCKMPAPSYTRTLSNAAAGSSRGVPHTRASDPRRVEQGLFKLLHSATGKVQIQRHIYQPNHWQVLLSHRSDDRGQVAILNPGVSKVQGLQHRQLVERFLQWLQGTQRINGVLPHVQVLCLLGCAAQQAASQGQALQRHKANVVLLTAANLVQQKQGTDGVEHERQAGQLWQPTEAAKPGRPVKRGPLQRLIT
mmetsp:Transcript_32077/g.83157  ORF Transcript_32077/g.83157 Transcript_32077/m.83157 type:complete len:200 (-) Transcript_32077:670-1269(-)